MSLPTFLFNRALGKTLHRMSFAVLLIVACAPLVLGAHSPAQSDAAARSVVESASVLRGESLFVGNEPLVGRLRDHADPLPSEVLTCNHCHATSLDKPVQGSDAPVLDAPSLMQFKSRRNSPQSRYNEESFCKLMRTNVDPVYVLVAKQMPIYKIDDEQCASLWLFLTTKGNSQPKQQANQR